MTVEFLKGDIPAKPDEFSDEEIAMTAAALLGIETLWGICVVFATAGNIPVRISVAVEDESFREPYEPMQAAREWHEAVGVKRFVELDESERAALASLRSNLIGEETDEVRDELWYLREGHPSASRAHLAKELADLLYVVYGTADVFEIDLPAVFAAVHANNMTKVDPETGKVERREDGKILKPKGYKPLDVDEIAEIIAA